MARASGTRFVFEADALPALPGALELAAAGVETGGAAHNRRFVAGRWRVGAGVVPALVTLAHDPQTAGGLLAGRRAGGRRRMCQGRARKTAGVEGWWIGEVAECRRVRWSARVGRAR